VPAQFGNAATGEAEPALAMPAWREVFLEPRLQQVIALALQNNRDLRVAVLQVEKERAQYRIQRAALLPSVDASGSVTRSRVSDANSETGVTQVTESDAVQVGISSWELDLFGRIRSLKNEALQNWLASAENQRAARTSLVAEVATAWLALAADEQSLAFTQQTLDSQQQTLQRTEARHAQGWPRAGPVAGADQRGSRARRWPSCRPSRRRIAMHCSCWWGAAGSGPAADRAGAGRQRGAGAVAGQPAVQRAAAAPGRVVRRTRAAGGQRRYRCRARAFFPTLALTANYGHSSTALSTLFSAGTRGWSFAPSITAPIFHAGALKASLDASKIGRDIGIAQYEGDPAGLQ
jgi:multidrug efflux system outer membrane protein